MSVETITKVGLSSSSLERHLGYWMRQVSNQVSGAFSRALAEQHTSVAEWVVLSRIHDTGGILPSELARALGLTRGAVSKILDKLEHKRWISREAHAEDGRMQVVTLTPAGERALPVLATIADRNDDTFFGVLDRKERRRLARLLRNLAAAHAMENVPLD